MIPAENNDLAADFEIEDEPSFTYALNTSSMSVAGTVDSVDAVRQAVLKILNTEQGVYPIYSYYGVQIHDLVGKPLPYVMSEVKRRITDALLTDDRISDVTNFSVQQKNKRVLLADFTVETVFGGSLDFEREVNV